MVPIVDDLGGFMNVLHSTGIHDRRMPATHGNFAVHRGPLLSVVDHNQGEKGQEGKSKKTQ